MNQQNTFADVLDAAEQLDDEAQAELVAVLRRRLAERGRERVAATVRRPAGSLPLDSANR